MADADLMAEAQLLYNEATALVTQLKKILEVRNVENLHKLIRRVKAEKDFLQSVWTKHKLPQNK